MKTLVCIKQVPGTTEVEVDDNGNLIRSGVDAKMNPYDLYALETALKLQEDQKGEVSVITMGPPQSKEVIREAYMMGVNQGFLLTDRRFAGADVLATSYTLAQGAYQAGDFDLILCGKQTTDGDTAQVGPEMAEYLGIPHVANVKTIVECKENSLIVEVEMPTSIQTVEVNFPCLITVEKGIFQPRLPSYRLKKKTKYQEITELSLDHFKDINEKRYGLSGSPTQVERIFPPEQNTTSERWEGENLGDKLYQTLVDLKFLYENK
ncbi:electron transfer flavoprotein subunit beta/FixA family protein [Isachenkonia alkalipeptolytica]|uniref:Electron transfer flavoprotein small subunit n=1 Tax=Isachenkonia alkalipeptolytica TaxID=2565777 RepID=A0AA43XJ32_9CLOT|nr:electron transfer flavoprotein subunit beta/FixA family protein [Isachenkonia alkalipeptolytica]NBG87743.1 electron transfer flavoprotein subunit beta/FixA family protein [Isachenkonia alkalipeptolytica]